MSLQTSQTAKKFDKSAHVWRPCACCGAPILQERFEPPIYCCSCRNSAKKEVRENIYKNFSIDIWSLRLNKALKEYFIKEMNGSDELWCENVLHSARYFNTIWRTALNSIIPYVEINGNPPPENLRKIYLFKTTSTASRNRENLV